MQADDSAGNKLRGSLLNALVFVAIITLMTFIIVLLFKYGVRPPSSFLSSMASAPSQRHTTCG